MIARWTPEEDHFLLTHHGMGADFVASHDLGKPDGAGSRRLRKLTQSGAKLAFAELMVAEIKYFAAAGHLKSRYDLDTSRWDAEIAKAVSMKNGKT